MGLKFYFVTPPTVAKPFQVMPKFCLAVRVSESESRNTSVASEVGIFVRELETGWGLKIRKLVVLVAKDPKVGLCALAD